MCTMDLQAMFFILCFATLYSMGIGDAQTTFNVMNFGAIGDGKTDNSQAFLKAWEALCGASGGTSTLEIPDGTFLLKPVNFHGPCKSSNVHIQVIRKIIAPSTIDAWGGCESKFLLGFYQTTGLILDGSGSVDGQGSDWWRSQQCEPPRVLNFHNCNNLYLSGVSILNSPRSHVVVDNCNGVSISNLKITSPEDSPNTDGIDISQSSHVNIAYSSIGTGDDCVAVKGGSFYVNVTHVNCGPGHGISVGSLGKDGSFDKVEEVHVQHCTITGTQNGVRIKTWPGGSGYARKISFEQITLVAAKNPIIIDQVYSDGIYQEKAVAVSDVTYIGIQGTSLEAKAITFDCAAIGCSNIQMSQINITSSVSGKSTYAYCKNTNGKASYTIPNVPCLQSR